MRSGRAPFALMCLFCLLAIGTGSLNLEAQCGGDPCDGNPDPCCGDPCCVECCPCPTLVGFDFSAPTIGQDVRLLRTGEQEPACQPNCPTSPVVIALGHSDYRLTDVDSGVTFDLNADGRIEKVAWTELNTNIGFLALDRNGDGRIQDGSELFGNVSPQPQRIDRNGFSALAVFDQESEGGNSDQVIDFHDTIFQRLRIWIDRNHDGISAIDELATLPEVGIEGISLDFEQAIRRDANSNLFRYRSRVLGIKGAAVANWAYDVFLQVAQNSPVSRTLSRFKFAGTKVVAATRQ